MEKRGQFFGVGKKGKRPARGGAKRPGAAPERPEVAPEVRSAEDNASGVFVT